MRRLIADDMDLVKEKFSWSTLKRDVREYMLFLWLPETQRQADKDRQREAANAEVDRVSPGRRVKVGDFVMVRESDSALSAQGTHPKLLHDYFTGPWVVTSLL